MVRGSGCHVARAVRPVICWPRTLLRASGQAHRVRGRWPELSGMAASGDVFARPILVEGKIEGTLTADATSASPAETRRLMGVLAGQAVLVLARMRMVAELDRQARQLNAIVSHAPVGVVLEDAEGMVVYANPVIERLYGVAAESLAGGPADQLLERAAATLVVDPEAEPGAPSELHLRERGTVVHIRRVVI